MVNQSMLELVECDSALLPGVHESRDLIASKATSKIFIFECLMNKVWVYIPPSLAIYDLGFVDPIATIMERMKKGECFDGVSGTKYRLSTKNR